MTIDDLIEKSEVIEIIQKVMKLSERHIRERVMKERDFPKPTRITGQRAIYRKPDIEKWLGVK